MTDGPRLNPEGCAENLLAQMDEQAPNYWTTDELGTFWHRMTEGCTLRLVRLKPEIVRHINSDDDLR